MAFSLSPLIYAPAATTPFSDGLMLKLGVAFGSPADRTETRNSAGGFDKKTSPPAKYPVWDTIPLVTVDVLRGLQSVFSYYTLFLLWCFMVFPARGWLAPGCFRRVMNYDGDMECGLRRRWFSVFPWFFPAILSYFRPWIRWWQRLVSGYIASDGMQSSWSTMHG